MVGKYDLSPTLTSPVGYDFRLPILKVIIDQMKHDVEIKDSEKFQDSQNLWHSIIEAFKNNKISIDKSFSFPCKLKQQ